MPHRTNPSSDIRPALFSHRRGFLQQAAGAAAGTLASALLPGLSLSLAATPAPGTSPQRLVLVVLRGGLDGLGAAPVIGDPAFADARGPLAQLPEPALALEGPYALHPALKQMHSLFGQGELAVIHAAGLPYKERSHFDAQQVLESGGTQPYQLSTGWLARALKVQRQRGMAISTAVPLVLRGGEEIDTWAPSALPEPAPDLISRLQQLYAADPALAQALARARGLRQDPQMPVAMDMASMQGGARNAAVALARKAGEFLARPGGPQAAVIEMNGWDTHANQAAPNGALANNLRTLDAALAALRETMRGEGLKDGTQHGLQNGTSAGSRQDWWARTVVLVVTEFGREVAVNGTLGTDHGSGGVAFALGGAVAGGRVIADWPGLARAADVWLGDSLGEMALYYGLADAALLGGSFAPLGGQNLIELIAAGCAVLTGPHTYNFADATLQACEAGVAWQTPDMAAALQAVAQRLEDPEGLA
ncbi:MAG: DUF1501 domain-containing protein, partial [Rubrivivax sp.]